jgi:glycosyltransferase involved in cell wall biosynthesis
MRRSWCEQLTASTLLGNAAGALLLLRSLVMRGASDARLVIIVTAARRITNPILRVGLARVLARWQREPHVALWRTRRIGWAKHAEDLRTTALTTSLLLKAPGLGGEKGVLYCSFEYNWLRLISHPSARRLLSDYFLVGASSWSPPDYAAMLSVASVARYPLFLGVSHPSDAARYALLKPRVRAVPIMASDWINPEFYTPRPFSARDIDILMVANFSPFKRHWLLFDALSRMRRDLHVTLIGIPAPGRGERELRDEARAAGVKQQLEIVVNAPIELVANYQCRAKTSVILSLREGSCVAVAESLFAGCPVAMLHNAHVGSKAYINADTGVLVGERRLDRELTAFLAASASYKPRAWAMANITCQHASSRLNRILQDYATSAGQPWTRDITPMCWRYVPSYVDPADEQVMAPHVARLQADYGIELETFTYRAH